MSKLDIRIGDKFNQLTVLKELPRKVLPSGQTNRTFLCVCDCGKQKEVRLVHLSRGRIKSCGCLKRVSNTKSETYIRKIWRAIKYRTQPNYCERHLYYDKGIRVCEEWLNNYDSFKKWAETNELKKGYHIDRIDGNKGYNPNNCRVVTPTVNANNRENTFYVYYKGKKRALMMLLREKGLLENDGAIRGRIKRGWSVEKAIDTPIRKSNYVRSKSNLQG